MSLQEAKQFVAHFVTGDYSPEEYAAFLQWLKGATVDELNAIADEHEALHERWDLAGLTPTPEWIAELEGKLDRFADGEEESDEETPVREIGITRVARRTGWIAAASVVVLLAGGVILYTQRGLMSGGGIKPEDGRPALPETSKAITVPMGGEAKEFVLADGSRVLLNAASTLKYPASFNGAERMVELSGEAYFEVSPNSGKPFRVMIRDAKVDVLGTSFNVMAYDDEPVSRTTLIEGAVRIESRSQKRILKRGQQAEITYSSTGAAEAMRIKAVDANAAMAWKKGEFKFTDETLDAVMRVVGRYYNVEVQCDPGVAGKRGSGIISRAHSLDQSMHQLESMGLHFDKKGQIVKVTLKQ